jgi:hypothetical protein
MRRQQLHALDHLLFFVVEEPIFTRFEAGNHGMPRWCEMLWGMLTWRTVAASDVPALRASTEVKPPASRCQTLHTAVPTWFWSSINSQMIFLHRTPSNQCPTLFTLSGNATKRRSLSAPSRLRWEKAIMPRHAWLPADYSLPPIGHKLWRCAHDFQAKRYASEAIDPAGLSSFTDSSATLSKNTLNSKNSLSGPTVLTASAVAVDGVHVVVDAFERVVYVHLGILPSAYIGKMTAYECVELVREDLIEHL